MAFLLDTNVLSESSKPTPNPSVLQWLEVHDDELYISAISLGEIVKGIESMPNGRRQKSLRQWFERIEIWAAGRVIPLSAEVLREWGRLCARHERKGRRLPVLDSLIAATALANDLILVTRDVSDYPDEVSIFDPWMPES